MQRRIGFAMFSCILALSEAGSKAQMPYSNHLESAIEVVRLIGIDAIAAADWKIMQSKLTDFAVTSGHLSAEHASQIVNSFQHDYEALHTQMGQTLVHGLADDLSDKDITEIRTFFLSPVGLKLAASQAKVSSEIVDGKAASYSSSKAYGMNFLATQFSAEERSEITTFYQSPSGRRLTLAEANAMIEIRQASKIASQNMVKRLHVEMKKYQPELGAQP